MDFAQKLPLGAFPDVLLFRGAEVTDGYVLPKGGSEALN